MFEGFIPALTLVFFSELTGLTQLLILHLGIKYNHKRFQIFLGGVLAHVIIDSITIVLGIYLGMYLPEKIMHIGIGVIFLTMGIITIKNNHEKKVKERRYKNAFLASLLLIGLAELGDRTQLASGLLGAEFKQFFPVALGMTVGISLAIGLNVIVGHYIAKRIKPAIVNTISGFLFILFGILSILAVT